MYKVGDKVTPRKGKFAFFPDKILTVTSVADSTLVRGGQLLGFYGQEPVWVGYNFKKIDYFEQEYAVEYEATEAEKALVCMKKDLEPKKIDFSAITKAIAEGS
jgi:hypothetical protein